jgi:uncharacterized membrane protein/YHS domain-containing protein
MILFLVHTVGAFLPLAFCLGVLCALLQSNARRRLLAPLSWSVLLGLIAGGMLYGVAAEGQQLTLVRTVLRGALLVTALGALLGTLLGSLRGTALRTAAPASAAAFAAVLAGQGCFALRDRIYYEGLSASSVLNTELILNLGGILAGCILLGLLTPLVRHMGLLVGRLATGALAAVAVAGLALLWGAEALLGLMRLEWLELTSGRLSFVAVVTDQAFLRSYLLLLLVALLALLFLRRTLATCRVSAGAEQAAARRREISLRLGQQRWFKMTAMTVLLLAGALLYHDLYASRPPGISEPTLVRPGSDGLLRFESEQFKDGRLYRFAHVMEDGKVIRFFLMNRFRDQVKIGVALDACLLCGDLGYIREGENLICLACNVSIFIPSLGKGGGCNPIPLPHENRAGEILIAVADLEAGARYFSEVKAIETTDPVTGETLINTEAPYQYEYQGRTYFFGSEASWKLFRKAPRSYLAPHGASISGPGCAAHGKG